MNPNQHLNETTQKMRKSLDRFREELAGVRTGRATPALLETIKASAYGQKMALRDLASINAPEPRLLTLQVWDQANVSAVEKALRDCDLSLNPVTENNIIRVPIPPLSEERRREMSRLMNEKSEAARVSVRQIRREAIDEANKAEKRKEVSEDEKFKLNEKVQKITEDFSSQMDTLAKQKSDEILQI
jgi:ribosome recycling factor